ncbi:hypothetical protein FOL47_007148 [Perkinsus chesapeaki]|uniref:t-SNARE coiled-coil homology domain-containing protein n=1 Tax=Perkinsus chesapeaki TaxID=330153 RepID=A0A7J6LMJ0_PERCH|nr:hypothetical protein FOL47_007148 [Perkinsus chesapeaki]
MPPHEEPSVAATPHAGDDYDDDFEREDEGTREDPAVEEGGEASGAVEEGGEASGAVEEGGEASGAVEEGGEASGAGISVELAPEGQPDGQEAITIMEEHASTDIGDDLITDQKASDHPLEATRFAQASLEDLQQLLAWSISEGRRDVVKAVFAEGRIHPDHYDPSGVPWLVSTLQQRPTDRTIVEAFLEAKADRSIGVEYVINSGSGGSVSSEIQVLLGVVPEPEAASMLATAAYPPGAAATAPVSPAVGSSFRAVEDEGDHLKTTRSSPVISRTSPTHNIMMASTQSSCRSQMFQGNGSYMVSLSNFNKAPKWTMGGRNFYSCNAANPGPGAYDPPILYSSPKMKGAPRYAFGNSQRFMNRKNELPGPGKYQPKDPVLAASLSYGFGTSVRPPIGGPSSRSAALMPGPGTYSSTADQLGSGPSYTLRSRSSKDTLGVSRGVLKNPGPGTYSPSSILKEHHGYSFPHSGGSLKRAFKVPGPGSYSLQNVKGTGTSSPAFSMSSRPAGWNVPNKWSSKVPGPGSYKSNLTSFGALVYMRSSHLGRHQPPLSHYGDATDEHLEESHGLLAQELEHRKPASSGEKSHAFVDERVAHERHVGISRIHEQVQQVSDMFRDLAVMVSDQGQQIASVENTVETTVNDSKGEQGSGGRPG